MLARLQGKHRVGREPPWSSGYGGDLCSEGCGFESGHRVLDGHNISSHIFVIRIVLFVSKDENKRKRGRRFANFFKKIQSYVFMWNHKNSFSKVHCNLLISQYLNGQKVLSCLQKEISKRSENKASFFIWKQFKIWKQNSILGKATN